MLSFLKFEHEHESVKIDVESIGSNLSFKGHLTFHVILALLGRINVQKLIVISNLWQLSCVAEGEADIQPVLFSDHHNVIEHQVPAPERGHEQMW